MLLFLNGGRIEFDKICLQPFKIMIEIFKFLVIKSRNNQTTFL